MRVLVVLIRTALHLKASSHLHICGPYFIRTMAFLSPSRSKVAPIRPTAAAAQLGFPKGNAVVVGAGPAGCLMAVYMIRRGYHVHLVEKRGTAALDETMYVTNDSRSYSLLLSSRAVRALEAADIHLPSSLLGPLVGGCLHLPNGKTRMFHYSSDPELRSFGVSRIALVAYLQKVLLKRYSGHVTPHFGWALEDIDDENSAALLQVPEGLGEPSAQKQLKYDLLVGADGVSSKTRGIMLELDKARRNELKDLPPMTLKFTQNHEVYKSFYVRPSLAQASDFYKNRNYVQSWPALNILLVGMADGSFWGGSKNPELMHASSALEVESIFRDKVPALYDLLVKENPDFAADYAKQPAISFGGSVILSRFNHRNIVLIGDAAHAMFPSYGTGCVAALEDCWLLDKVMEDSEASAATDFEQVAAEFSRRRLADAHAIVEMNSSLELFPRGFSGMLQMAIFATLHKLFPKLVRPTAYQLLGSDVPFAQIRQQKRMENLLFIVFAAITGFVATLLVLKLVTTRK